MAVAEAFDTPLERLGLLPNGMNWRGDWDVNEQYYLNDVVRSPANLSSYILNGRDALRGGVDPTLNPEWVELSSATTGVIQVNAGAGITIGGTPTVPIVENDGILTITAGNAGITVVGGGTVGVPPFNAVISNSGVLGVTNGLGINITGPPSNPVINNNGVRTLTAGAGMIVNNADPNNPVVENGGVTSIISGGGLTITDPTGPATTITNDGVIQVNAGTGITVGGTQQQPVISLTTSAPLISRSSLFNNVPLGNPPIVFPAGGSTDISVGLNGLFATTMGGGPADPNAVWMWDLNELILYASTTPATAGTLSLILVDGNSGNTYTIPTGENGEPIILGGGSNPVILSIGVLCLPISTIRAAGLNGITALRIVNNTTVPFVTVPISNFIWATYYPNGIQ